MDALLECLFLPPERAREAWLRWRGGIDIDGLPYESHQLLPALNPQFAAWLEGDPAAGIFQGIVRMVWTQNQVRLRTATEVTRLLEEAGVERPVIVGPAAWSLRAPARAIRAIPYLSFLVARTDVEKAAGALTRAGWHAYGKHPSRKALDQDDHVSFVQNNLSLNLHWRLIPTVPGDAAACEEAFWMRLSAIKWKSHTLVTTSPEATLLHMLCGRREADVVPWQADVALAGTNGMDWPVFHRLAARFGPLALDRLRDLRRRELVCVPDFPAEDLASLRHKFRMFWGESDWRRFVRNLRARWRGRAAGQARFIGARRAYQNRRSLLP